MGVFDFPRINFSGDIDINVPTINNSYYYPLAIYDAIRAKPLLPPRLYFSSESYIKTIDSNIKIAFDPDRDDQPYILIEDINTIEKCREWCQTPLTQSSLDTNYWKFYTAADNDKKLSGKSPLVNNAPGYWNYFGDMGITMSDVSTKGIQTFENGEVNTYTKDSSHVPTDVASLLNSSFTLNSSPQESARTTCSIAETISNQSVFASFWCDKVTLYDTETKEPLLQGNPFKFSALIYAAWRVMNWWPPMAGSAQWCSAVPMDEISDSEQSKVIQFFEKYGTDPSKKLKGVFVTFSTHAVFENRFDQEMYQKTKNLINPAQASTMGSIVPWYEGELKAGVMGRHLVAQNQAEVYTNSLGVKIQLAPAIAKVTKIDEGALLLSVNMGNTMPEQIIPNDPTVDPIKDKQKLPKRGRATFDTFDLGNLKFIVRDAVGNPVELGALPVDPVNTPLTDVRSKGAVFDFLVTDSYALQLIDNNPIEVLFNQKTVLKESEYMIFSDQKGMYTEEGDTHDMGYYSFGGTREPCVLNIYRFGIPVDDEVPITMYMYEAPEAGNDPQGGPSGSKVLNLKNGDQVDLSLNGSEFGLKNNAIYYFTYQDQYPSPPLYTNASGGYSVMDTGSFVCLRVHPKLPELGKYIDPSHADYPTPVTWEVVYEEIFKLYDVAYPAMAMIHPFTKEIWDNGIMAGMVVQRTAIENFASVTYMPRSRELSKDQRTLLQLWAKQYS